MHNGKPKTLGAPVKGDSPIISHCLLEIKQLKNCSEIPPFARISAIEPALCLLTRASRLCYTFACPRAPASAAIHRNRGSERHANFCQGSKILRLAGVARLRDRAAKPDFFRRQPCGQHHDRRLQPDGAERRRHGQPDPVSASDVRHRRRQRHGCSGVTVLGAAQNGTHPSNLCGRLLAGDPRFPHPLHRHLLLPAAGAFAADQ